MLLSGIVSTLMIPEILRGLNFVHSFLGILFLFSSSFKILSFCNSLHFHFRLLAWFSFDKFPVHSFSHSCTSCISFPCLLLNSFSLFFPSNLFLYPLTVDSGILFVENSFYVRITCHYVITAKNESSELTNGRKFLHYLRKYSLFKNNCVLQRFLNNHLPCVKRLCNTMVLFPGLPILSLWGTFLCNSCV
jgi:hypothetical protein